MDRARRLEYLRALGVEPWERRDMPPPPIAPAPDVADAAAASPSATHTIDARSEAVPPARHAASLEPPTSTSAQSAMPAAEAESSTGAPASPQRTVPTVPAAPITPIAPPASGTPRTPGPRAGAAESLARIPVITPARAAGTLVPPETESRWDALKAEVLACTKCTLHSTRTQGVFGVGNRRAEWLVIGEAPGAEEDRRGEPFVGRAGQLLNAMLAAIGLPREQVFIANVLKSRPPSNRDPKPDEVAACLPFLMRQIALLQPRLMLAVGRIAAQNLLATDVPLSRLRGQVHYFGELNTPLIVTYHPAYLLRTPADKRKAWEDLKFARSTFQRLASQEK
jgi:DNA polymerase